MGRRCTRIITKGDFRAGILELDVCGMIAFDTVDIRRDELKGDAAVFAWILLESSSLVAQYKYANGSNTIWKEEIERSLCFACLICKWEMPTSLVALTVILTCECFHLHPSIFFPQMFLSSWKRKTSLKYHPYIFVVRKMECVLYRLMIKGKPRRFLVISLL